MLGNSYRAIWGLLPFLIFMGFLVAFSGGVSGAARNVVLFVVDDQGLDAVGAYGNPAIRTPNLDRLAVEGTRFDYAYATTASCSASRSVILTGLHNHHNGQYGHEHSFYNFHTHSWVRSLPVLLEGAGYRTARIGKFHVQPESVYRFQVHLTGNQGGARNPVSMAELARHFIAAPDERPFFLYFCTSDPHRGGGFAEDLPLRPDYFGNHMEYDGVEEVRYSPDEVLVPPFLPDTPEARAELAQYYQAVSRIDQGLGRLIEILKEAGKYENTLILYTSDNGAAFAGAKTTVYEPGIRLPLIVRSPDQKRRGVASEALVSFVDITPTILEFAGVGVPDAPIPTGPTVTRAVLELFGETVPEAPGRYFFHGRSFLSILEEENPEGWDEVYASHTFHETTMYYPMRVIRRGQYKYILNLAHQLPYPFATDLYVSPTWRSAFLQGMDAMYGKRRVADYIQRPRHELYDLESDPHETVNLAARPEYAEVLRELQEKLRRFQERTRDPWLVKYYYE